MFTDAAFGSESKVDKWGRAVRSKGGERLKKFYGIGEEEKEGEKKGEAGEEKEDGDSGKVDKQQKKKQQKPTKQADKRQPAKQTSGEEEEQEGEQDETAGDSDEPVEEDADDTYSKSYLSSRAIAPPSSSDEDDSPHDDDDDEPASPTFPNILGSDSDDSDIEPLYTDADAAEADEQPAEQIALGDATDTLALVNMDWDRLRALDIYMLCRSFVADSDGTVVSVAVYRSEYGKERMAEEEKYGPIGLYGGTVAEYRERIDKKVREQMEEEEKHGTADDDQAEQDEEEEEAGKDEADVEEEQRNTNAADDQNEDEDDEDEQQDDADIAAATSNPTGDNDDTEETPLDQEKLRQYELSRLRYHYAIIRCSSIPAATALYTALDASEFESSANKLDLRFVPTSTHFDTADIRDQCDQSDMDERALTEYRAPAVFVTKALQHSRVELTWDAEDEERKRKLKAGSGGGVAARKGRGKGRKGVDVDEGEDDLRVYLASDDEEDGYGSDAVVEVDEAANDDEDVKPVLKKKARARYTALLSELKGQKAEKGGEGEKEDGEEGGEEEEEGERVIEMTFEPGLKAKGEELVKRVTEREERKNETAFEKRAREVREKKKEKKQQRRKDAKGDDADAEAAEEEEEEDVVDVDMEDDFFKGAFDDDEYMPVGKRAKSFFADDERKERTDKKLNREMREKMDEDEDEDGDGDGVEGGAGEDEKKRRAELELLMLPNQPGEEDGTDGKQHYHLSQLIKANKTKGKKSKKDTADTTTGATDVTQFHVDVSDPRFAAMYERADYSIDPTHPAYKPTAEMERVMAERQRRRLTQSKQREQTVKQRKAAQQQTTQQPAATAAESSGSGSGGLDALVASVKAKTKARESEVERRKRKDEEVRRAAVAGTAAGGKRLGEQPLRENNKKQKLKGDMRI